LLFLGYSCKWSFRRLSAVDAHFIRPKALQAFFGFFEPALTVFTFFLNFLMAGYFIRRLYMTRSLLLTPAVLLVCSLSVVLTPFFLLSGILIRVSDESMAFSLNHPVREILYIPVPAHLKHKAKAFIDIFVSHFAKVVGALVLFVFAFLLNKEIEGYTPVFDPELARYLSWVVIAFLIPWALIGLKIGKEYLDILKRNIRPLWSRAERDLTEKVDVEYAKLVFDTIDSQCQEPGEKNARLRHHIARYLEVYFADIFKLLGLYYPQKDIRMVYQNIRTGTRNSVAIATEWLDNVLKKDLKDVLLPIVEDLDSTEKTKRFQKILKNLSDF
jgi:hypothetical protein